MTRLALWSGLLTLLTLGFYRFWMKTRLRRYYWSSIRVGGVPAEYTGDPMEKLLGFFIAVTFLAFYIGIVNLALMFISFSLFEGNGIAYLLSFAGVLPIWFYAQYRARRYVLARTRWRGIRLGMENGAWGYAARALWHWGLTVLTLGLYWPRMTFWLTKYKTDRTWFGTAALVQEGRWLMLLRAAWPAYLVWLSTLALASLMLLEGELESPSAAAGMGILALPLLIPAGLYYHVKSWAILTRHTRAEGLALEARPSALRVGWIYVFGYLSLALMTALLVSALLLGGLFAAGMLGATLLEFETLKASLPKIGTWATVAFGAALYFGMFLLWGGLRHGLVTLPLWRHYAQSVTLTKTDGLDAVQQRDRDTFAEAEGFAEALDFGASI